ncbi:MAG: hypothetical protein KDB90_05705 [Planctomycetes bacterium]|nr:hypothetical protein [Planctomycetota bacterium]
MKRLALILVVPLLAGCVAKRPIETLNGRNEVVVMGMIHSGHLRSESYGLDVVEKWVRAIRPDYVMVEIPPDRLPIAIEQYEQNGVVTEPRSLVYPEFVQVALPLRDQLHFELIPVSAWTAEMSRDRSTKLEIWKHTRPDDTAEVNAGYAWLSDHTSDDPFEIHSDRYDEAVRQGLEPYSRLFNDDLGPGGWENITGAHYALITAALDQHKGEEKRFLIMFGAWHKYWFLDHLRERDDIVLRNPAWFLK